MKFVFASDSFKGTLTSMDTIELLTESAKEVFGEEHCECIGVPVADGGEGTVDAILKACKGEKITLRVHDPFMRKIPSFYGKTDRNKAVLEMAAASGLSLLQPEEYDPMEATTYGTGELIRDALQKGFTEIFIAIGGSATNDGGMGCMRALGVRFLDANGKELEGKGVDLEKIRDIDDSGLLPGLKRVKINVICDVTNPLCGKEGASYTYGRQKGAGPAEMERLERGMQNYRKILRQKYGKDANAMPGAGAAGGLGAALMIFLDGVRRPGIETVLDLIHFDEMLKGCSLVVTGEGKTDGQTCFGKAVQGIGRRCRKYNVPVIALSGSMGKGAWRILEDSVDSIMVTLKEPSTLEEALKNARANYADAAVRMFRMVRVGMQMAQKQQKENSI